MLLLTENKTLLLVILILTLVATLEWFYKF